ncbi:MAG: cell division protein ZapA [Alphaproteobacteria bacterium]|nr:cell division protein ZapA [Alphaproteobacteria bacterium]
MSQVEVTVNGKNYQIICDDGQEARLAELGDYLEKRVQELVSSIGQVGDTRLLVMTALMISDELAQVHANLKKTDDVAVSLKEAEAKLASIVNDAATRIEIVTQRFA